jgi:hypothetical protein
MVNIRDGCAMPEETDSATVTLVIDGNEVTVTPCRDYTIDEVREFVENGEAELVGTELLAPPIDGHDSRPIIATVARDGERGDDGIDASTDCWGLPRSFFCVCLTPEDFLHARKGNCK